jgi:glucose-6-phosphate isomerase
VTDKLLRDAIDAFLAPMAKLLDGIERKREAIVTNRPAAIEADLPPELEKPLAERVKRAHDEDVARRIWERDGTLWAPEGTPEVTDRLGWLTIADKLLEEADTLDAFREECVADGLTDVVLLGMGGSSLAPEVFRLSYGQREGGLRLHVLDSTEPLQIEAVEREIDLAKTLFLVSTKSGGTIETISLFKHFHALQGDGSHYVLITDPSSSLLDLAEENSFRRAFQNDPEIGGRYSALSYFGLVPAALAGIDIRPLLEGAQVAAQACSDFENPEDNAGLWLGLALGELARAGRDKLTFVVDDPIASFGVWVEQLIAESTGKQGRGILPVADEPLVDAGAYGGDRVFLHLRNTDAPDAGHD